MASQWEQCLKAHISKTKSAKVFKLDWQVSHVELLHIFYNATYSATMWSVITCFMFWLITHEPWGLSKQCLQSVFLGWYQVDWYRPRPFASKFFPPFWIFFKNAFFATFGTFFIQSSPNLIHTIFRWSRTQLISSFFGITYRLSVIGYQTFEGVAWCIERAITLQCWFGSIPNLRILYI